MIEPRFKISARPISDNYSEIIIEPLQQNFGHTLGNAIRRVVLSALPGAAAVRVKIDGVDHQFSTLENIQQDTLEILLNIKGIRFAVDSFEESYKAKLDAKGKQIVTAGDLELPAGVKVVNPGHVIADLATSKACLALTIEIESGYGYVPVEKFKTDEIGVIPLDATFSPVLKANYSVEATRVGRRTDWDKVKLDILTDGTITPLDAVLSASKILSAFFVQVYKPADVPGEDSNLDFEPSDIDTQSVDELDLPLRVANALKNGGYRNLIDLKSTTVDDLLKVKNIGQKSAEDIVKKVKQKYK